MACPNGHPSFLYEQMSSEPFVAPNHVLSHYDPGPRHYATAPASLEPVVQLGISVASVRATSSE